MLNYSTYDVVTAVRDIYKDGSTLRRLMLHNRPYICPFDELINRIPQDAKVLDIGCGDGLFLNVLLKLDRISQGLGFDTNSTAIAYAQTIKNSLPNALQLEFLHWSVGQPWPEGEFDVVTMIDVLHHIPQREKRDSIEKAASLVKPHGLLIYKDIGIRPRWRAFFNSLHDLILTRELVTYTSLDEVASWVRSQDLKEIERRTFNRLWYGHELLVFRK